MDNSELRRSLSFKINNYQINTNNYEVLYSNNDAIGTATVTVKATDKYGNAVETPFTDLRGTIVILVIYNSSIIQLFIIPIRVPKQLNLSIL